MIQPSTSEIEFTVLGSGTCALQPQRSMSGYAVRHQGFFCLLDCGHGALRRCLEAGLQPLDIDAVLVSHFHLDHIADILSLLWALKHAPDLNRTKPLTFIGPPGLLHLFQGLPALYGSWLEHFPFTISIEEVRQQGFAIGPWQVETLPMRHGASANGYRLQSNGRVIAYSGDTGECAEVVELGRRADLFVLECSFVEDSGAENHLHAALAARLASRAECKKLLLTHFYPECDRHDVRSLCENEFPGTVELARDLMRLIL